MLFLPSFVLNKIFYATDIIFNIHLYFLLQNGAEKSNICSRNFNLKNKRFPNNKKISYVYILVFLSRAEDRLTGWLEVQEHKNQI